MATMNRATVDGEPQSSRPIIEDEAQEVGTLATLSKAELDIQIATAKRYPRSIQKFQREALALATLDEETAKSCYYRVPRDGKFIEGGSIRLAEICGSAWGNNHIGARVVDIDQKNVTAQAIAWDLEKNFKVVVEIRRGIVNRYGKTYTDDMIRTTAQAAMSVALRNAIFRIVSPALVKTVLAKAKEVSLGKSHSMEQKREAAFKAMASVGAKPAEIFRVLGKRGLEDVDVDDLINLNGMFTAIKDGETSWTTILEEFDRAQPRTEAEVDRDLKKNFKTDMDDVVIPEDSTTPKPDTGQAPRNDDAYLTEDEWGRVYEQELRPRGIKFGTISAALHSLGLNEPTQLRRSDAALFISKLQQESRNG